MYMKMYEKIARNMKKPEVLRFNTYWRRIRWKTEKALHVSIHTLLQFSTSIFLLSENRQHFDLRLSTMKNHAYYWYLFFFTIFKDMPLLYSLELTLKNSTIPKMWYNTWMCMKNGTKTLLVLRLGTYWRKINLKPKNVLVSLSATKQFCIKYITFKNTSTFFIDLYDNPRSHL